MARLFVTLPDDLHDKLRIKGIEKKKNNAELVTEALEEYLDFESKDKFSQETTPEDLDEVKSNSEDTQE